jgi:hypothetical protein
MRFATRQQLKEKRNWERAELSRIKAAPLRLYAGGRTYMLTEILMHSRRAVELCLVFVRQAIEGKVHHAFRL